MTTASITILGILFDPSTGKYEMLIEGSPPILLPINSAVIAQAIIFEYGLKGQQVPNGKTLYI